MAISVVEGRPGTGKTVFLTNMVISYLKSGHHVYTNIEIQLPPRHPWNRRLHIIQSLEDIINLREGKIVLDEVQTYLNSRNWDKLDIRFQLLLQQHRKRGLDIMGATQSVKRADVVFRELIHYFYGVRKIFTISLFGKVYGFFLLREFDPDTVEKDRSEYKPIGWPSLVVADPFTFRVYDTTQEYKFDDGIGKYEIIKYKLVEGRSVKKQLIDKQTVDTTS
jgi:hypothetical protein